jgi:hypothetical protein
MRASNLLHLLAIVALVSMAAACIARPHLEINPQQMPIYPNAQDMIYTAPATEPGLTADYTWQFTTSDSPEAVWEFYRKELGRRWRFDKSTVSDVKWSVLTQSCPFYGFDMEATPAGESLSSITIRLHRELCR